MNKFIRNNKGVLIPILIFIVSLIGLIYLGLNILKQQAVDANKEKLQILANEKAVQVNMFLESQKEKQAILASMNVFKEAVRYPNDTAKIEIAKNRINELKENISRIAIFTSDGIMFIAESGPVPIDYSALPYFASKDKEIIFMRYYDEYQKKDYYSILGPIYDSIEKDKVIGSVAFNIDLDEVSVLMKESLAGGENAEVYLIDETGLLLSNSKYVGKDNQHGILIQKIESEGAEDCLEDLEKYKKNGIIGEYRKEVMKYKNYMGDEVYGAHAYSPVIEGCVIAEKNVEEITKFSLIVFIKKTLERM